MPVQVIMTAIIPQAADPSEVCRIDIDLHNNVTIDPASVNPQFLDQTGDISIPKGTKVTLSLDSNSAPSALNLTMVANKVLGSGGLNEATIYGIEGYWKVKDSERGYAMYEGTTFTFTPTLLGMLDKFDNTFTRTISGLYQSEPVQDISNTGGSAFHVKNLTNKDRTLILEPAGNEITYSGRVKDPSLLPKNATYQGGILYINLSKNTAS